MTRYSYSARAGTWCRVASARTSPVQFGGQSMRKSFISRALAAAVLAPAVVGVAAAQPVHAAAGRQVSLAGTCGTTRDTTGSCSTTNTNAAVNFPVCGNHYVSCRPVNVQASSTSTYPQGLTV